MSTGKFGAQHTFPAEASLSLGAARAGQEVRMGLALTRRIKVEFLAKPKPVRKIDP